MPGTTVYNDGVRDGHIRSEIDHLNWLSIEQALHEDEFINVNGLPEQVMRDAYKRIYDAYQPGPVMDFEHWPEFFSYHHANTDDGQTHSKAYGGKGWRAGFSSAAPPLVPGSERFTLRWSVQRAWPPRVRSSCPPALKFSGPSVSSMASSALPDAPTVPHSRAPVPAPGKIKNLSAQSPFLN